jgi:hypothetical protein
MILPGMLWLTVVLVCLMAIGEPQEEQKDEV